MQNPPSNAHARAHIGNCMKIILPDPQIFSTILLAGKYRMDGVRGGRRPIPLRCFRKGFVRPGPMKSKNLCKKKRAQSGSIPGRLCSWNMEREFTQT
nr:hypothetical protein [Bacillaceae bacterium]